MKVADACGPPLLFPVTVMMLLPLDELCLTVILRLEFAGVPGDTFTVEGLNEAETPFGKPAALKVTGPAKPPPEIA